MVDFSTMLTNLSGKIKINAKRYGPQIMIVGGSIGTIAAIAMACVETKKAIKIVDESKKEIEEVRNKQITDGYTEKDKKKELTKAYTRTAGKLAITYAPAIGVEIASLGLIGGGAKIINDQKVTLATALATSLGDFKGYRKRLIEKFGDEGEKIDKELRYGLKELEITEEVEENGKKKQKKRKVYALPDNKSECCYQRILDKGNYLWDSHPDTVLFILRAKQKYFNDRLNAYGYVFLNEVLEELGFDRTRVGQEVGWIKNGSEDCYIDFRVTPVEVFHDSFETNEVVKVLPDARRNCAYVLDFNVDGSILTKACFPDQNGG